MCLRNSDNSWSHFVAFGFHLYFWRDELSSACEDWKTTKQLLFLAGGGGAVSKPQLNMASL